MADLNNLQTVLRQQPQGSLSYGAIACGLAHSNAEENVFKTSPMHVILFLLIAPVLRGSAPPPFEPAPEARSGRERLGSALP